MSELLAPSPISHSLSAAEMVASVASLPEYTRSRKEGFNLNRSIARAALEHVGMQHTTELLESDSEDTYEPELNGATIESARYTLVGELPSFVHGLEGIRAFHQENNGNEPAYASMKGRAARFNHAVKALIETDKTLKFNGVQETVSTLYGIMNRERWGADRTGYEREAQWFTKQFEMRLRGMQQEVLAHQIIETINSVSPIVDPKTKQKTPRLTIDTNVSVEDDLHGADMYITLDGVTFPIDIKASERTVTNAQKKSLHPKAIMTTGITSDELFGAFRVNTKRARRAAPAMLEKLYAARQEFIEKSTSVVVDSTASAELALAA